VSGKEAFLKKVLRDVRSGLYGVLIMHSLKIRGEMHGYGLRQEIARLTGALLTPSESTVYETLKKLEKAGIITSSWSIQTSGLPRKYYRLTPDGVKAYEEIRKEVISLIKAVLNALGEE
jgi:PadR family transcriptional regulator PadR